MSNVSRDYTQHFDAVMRVLSGRGLLLCATTPRAAPTP